jgi:hypothetical protein
MAEPLTDAQAQSFPEYARARGVVPTELKKGTQTWNTLRADWEAAKAASAQSVVDLEPIGRAQRTQEVQGAVTPQRDLQNRDRARAASVLQMRQIAQNPDYFRLGISRTPDSGAPMVFANGDDTSRVVAVGNEDVAVMSDGQRVPFRYAVAEANQGLQTQGRGVPNCFMHWFGSVRSQRFWRTRANRRPCAVLHRVGEGQRAQGA